MGRTHLGFRVKLVKGTGGVGLPIYFGLAQLVVSLIWLWICLSWYLFCLFSREFVTTLSCLGVGSTQKPARCVWLFAVENKHHEGGLFVVYRSQRNPHKVCLFCFFCVRCKNNARGRLFLLWCNKTP